MHFIDDLLNGITMYKVMLYGLVAITLGAFIFSLFGLLSFGFSSLLISLLLIVIVCYSINKLFAALFSISANVESVWITTFILFLILTPPTTYYDSFGVILTCVIAIASKYLLAWKKVHIFNPAAIALVIMGLAGSDLAIWWVATPVIVPAVVTIGLLVVRKIRRLRMFLTFVLTSLLFIVLSGLYSGTTISQSLIQAFTSWPLMFFGTVMLTEPLTTPSRKGDQLVYGIIVGALFGSQLDIGLIHITPELALVVGNIFSYLVSSRQKLVVKLRAREQISPSMYDLHFAADEQLLFQPGQYGEWTLGHLHPDSRGIRRYFTLASSPTEKLIHLGIKVFPQSSSFKRALLNMKLGDELVVGQVTGEFVLPKDKKNKLVFIAGGIGVTPFRSQIQYLLDTHQSRNVILLYACTSPEDFVYQELWKKAQQQLDFKVHYIITDVTKVPPSWTGKHGYINEKMLEELVPDYLERTFYLSGPGAMVQAYKQLIHRLGVTHSHVKTDYFPGF